MRELIRTKLDQGESRQQILAYFAERYGEWVLLAPPRSGFTALVWIAPYLGLAAAIAFVVWTVRRRPRTVRDEPAGPDAGRFLSEVDRNLDALRDQSLR
jgi:cytochrome c-type biogenesis protein CcmH